MDLYSFLSPFKWRALYRQRVRHSERMQCAEIGIELFGKATAANPDLSASTFLQTQVLSDQTIHFEDRGKTRIHRGTVLRQRKSVFLANSADLESFDWNEIIRLHINMWRLGIGLYGFSEFWGPRNWCFFRDGEMRVGDISHLTQDPTLICKCFSKEIKITKTNLLLLRQPADKSNLVKEYMEYLTSRLTPEVFAANWWHGS